MWHGQNQEDKIIAEYFGDKKGNLLSIGENDGINLSNCRWFLLNGWTGILIEPSLNAFMPLWEMYRDNPEKFWCYNVAIGNFVGENEFYESGTHLRKGDVGLVSSIKKESIKKWESTTEFTQTEVLVWTFEELQKEVVRMGRNNKYQFINIDAEEMDLEILKQIDLNEVDCQCLCIEHNSVLSVLQEIKEYCNFFGLNKEIGYNQENIILCR